MKITKCKGEGQGTCKRCLEIEGLEGCYCSDCVKELVDELEASEELQKHYLDVIRYGYITSDFEIAINGNHFRFRTILYNGVEYQHIMRNGECITFCET